MLALLLTAALSAQAIDAFAVPPPPAAVIQWLTANRDILIETGGARVVGRKGRTLTVRRDGIEVRLSESADIHADWAVYRVRMVGASRKLRSWSTDVSIQPCQGGTWISISISASVYGLGEARVQDEIEGAMRRVRGYLLGVLR
jgi:hypothetical protein